MFSFRNQPDFHPNSPDPLGPDYSPSDRDLDIRVGDSLRQLPCPEGLEDRIRVASTTVMRDHARMRLNPGRAALAVKRLAVAACLLVAVLAAFWMTSPSGRPAPERMLVQQQPLPDASQIMGASSEEIPLSVLMALDGSGLIASHELTWAQAHDELLTILEAENNSDAWGYLAVEIH